MGIVIFILLYLLSKKIYSYIKFTLLMQICIYIYINISSLIITEDIFLFIILFESIFFPICFISLFFSYSNRFIFAIYMLILYSSIGSILCIFLLCIFLFHCNIQNIIYFFDIFLLDNIYLCLLL